MMGSANPALEGCSGARGNHPLAEDLEQVLAETRDLWEELRGQRLFITGGTGFFGTWLLETFAWANDKLGLNATAVVLTRNLDTFRKKAPHLASHRAIQFHVGDVRSFEFPTGSFSHIIHAAAESSTKMNEENPLLMFDTIIQGTRHTLEFARQCGAKKFLLTSSGAVYGKQSPDLTYMPEDYVGAPDTMNPHSAYGEGKRAAELLCTFYARQLGIETKIARCFAFVGPYLPLDAHFAIGNFIRDGMQGGPIQVKGDGTPYRSYLYTADLAIWLWTILFRAEMCRPYNVGSKSELTIKSLATIVARTFQPELEVRIAEQPILGKPAERYVPSVCRAARELNLTENVNLDEAIKKTIAWHSSKIHTPRTVYSE
jgi:nucleoside-diphosphate-sugar epimerase